MSELGKNISKKIQYLKLDKKLKINVKNAACEQQTTSEKEKFGLKN